MILIDALYINKGGGLNLLVYLLESMISAHKDFFLLYDQRSQGRFDFVDKKEPMFASQGNRKGFYKKHRNDFSTVLCFANVPPPIKLKANVYTYFHNINMLTLGEGNLKSRIMMFLKRCYVFSLKNNTDFWMVQTSNTALQLRQHLGSDSRNIIILPFFTLRHIHSYQKHGDDYVFIGDYTGSKGHDEIVDAWRLLYREGFIKKLHLTCSITEQFLEKIRVAQEEGIPIINHGFMPFSGVDTLYQESKALVYPSSNESLGLGIIEAIHSGCDVIASDLAFTHAICRPSGVFNPHSPRSIANAVLDYERGNAPRSTLMIKNEIKDIINLLN